MLDRIVNSRRAVGGILTVATLLLCANGAARAGDAISEATVGARQPVPSIPSAKDPLIGTPVNDKDANGIGVIADILGTNQINIPLAAIKFNGSSVPVIIPLAELLSVNGTFQYWGTKQQFEEIPKHIVLLTPGTSSVALGGPLSSTLSVLAVPSVPISSNVVDVGSFNPQLPSPAAINQGQLQGNPYSRAGSDIKSVWGGQNSLFRKPF